MSNKDFKNIALIIVIFIAACIETDIYLPAFVDMMHYFSVDEEKIQTLLTWNFFGICLSSPFYGPISDAIGRRRPLLFALGLFFLGSIFTIFADDFDLMLLGRLLQGLGSGGCFSLGSAIIFDAFPGDRSISALSRINAICPFLMALAPALGGYLNCTLGFRANFIAIALFVFLSLIITLFFFEETLKRENQKPFVVKRIAQDIQRAVTCIPFWQLTIVVSLLNAGYIVFLSISAVLFIEGFGMSKTLFPFYQGALLVAWLIGSLTSTRCSEVWTQKRVKGLGMACVLCGGGSLAAICCVAPQNALLITLSMMLYAFGVNWAQGIYFPEGMQLLDDIKGITASLLTSARLVITALVVTVASYFYNGTIYPLMGVIEVSIAITFVTLYAYKRRILQTSASSHSFCIGMGRNSDHGIDG